MMYINSPYICYSYLDYFKNNFQSRFSSMFPYEGCRERELIKCSSCNDVKIINYRCQVLPSARTMLGYSYGSFLWTSCLRFLLQLKYI